MLDKTLISDPFQIVVVFFGVITLSLLLMSRYTIAQKISPVILILFFSALLANLNFIPKGATGFYDKLSGYAVPFAVCQVLMHIRFSEIRKTGLPMLKTFALASAGSFIGCIVSGLVLFNQLEAILAGESWKLAGPYIGTYIGGSINFFSMWTGLDIKSPDLFAAANAVDNLTLIPVFMFWVFCPQWLKRFYPQSNIEPLAEQTQKAAAAPAQLKLIDIIILVFTALVIMAVSGPLTKLLFSPFQSWLKMPSILMVTTLAIIAGQFKFIRDLHGAQVLGNFAFYVFFAAIGAMMDIPKAVGLAPVLFIYVVIIILVQISFVLLLGKLFGMDLRMIAVASLAAKAGPSTVAAYTSTKSWHDLTLSGMAAGLLGYAIGNYAGFAGAYLLKAITG